MALWSTKSTTFGLPARPWIGCGFVILFRQPWRHWRVYLRLLDHKFDFPNERPYFERNIRNSYIPSRKVSELTTFFGCPEDILLDVVLRCLLVHRVLIAAESVASILFSVNIHLETRWLADSLTRILFVLLFASHNSDSRLRRCIIFVALYLWSSLT